MYNEADRQIWDDLFAEVPDEWRAAPPSRAMEACAAWLHAVGARDALDIGCGVGRWSIWLAKQGFHVCGADFAPRGIEYARQWAADEGLEIPFSCTPIVKRAFPERRFDVVVATLVFDLVSTKEFETALGVCRDALGESGHLFAVFNPVEEPDGAEGNPTAGVTKVSYSDAQILEIVSAAGFRLLMQETLDQRTRGFLWRAAPGFGSTTS